MQFIKHILWGKFVSFPFSLAYITLRSHIRSYSILLEMKWSTRSYKFNYVSKFTRCVSNIIGVNFCDSQRIMYTFMEGINFSDCQINAFYVFEYSHVMIGITCTGWLQGLHWGWWGSKDNGWRHHECCTGKRSRMQGESGKVMLCVIFIKEVSYLHVWELQAWSMLWFHSINAVIFRNLFFNWFMRFITAFMGNLKGKRGFGQGFPNWLKLSNMVR